MIDDGLPVMVLPKDYDSMNMWQQSAALEEAQFNLLEEWYGKTFRQGSGWVLKSRGDFGFLPLEEYEGRSFSSEPSSLVFPVSETVIRKHNLIHLQRIEQPFNSPCGFVPDLLSREFCIDSFPVSWDGFNDLPIKRPEVIIEGQPTIYQLFHKIKRF